MAGPVVPSQEQTEQRKFVNFGRENITNVVSTNYPGVYPGESHAWDISDFRQTFTVIFHDVAEQGNEAIFSLVGIDASVVNAFRRILIAEVPTLAIEDVFMINNTSILHDEVLAARLGLIPLIGPLEGMRWLRSVKRVNEEGVKSQRTDFNAVKLTLNVECTWKEGGLKKKQQDPRIPDEQVYHNSHIYADSLQFDPIGRQSEYFPEDRPIRPSSDKILIAKMRPGQKINCVMHAVKSIGADHAKFSPVSTASYRLLPKTIITKPILGSDAKKFARCFPKGVIRLQEVTATEAAAGEGKEGELRAVVSDNLPDMLRDPVTRECLRHEEFKDKVRLGRVQDHFVFSVESSGQFPSEELFVESVKILRRKCRRSLDALRNMNG